MTKAETFGWAQDDWSLGVDVAAIANYTLNRTGWQKFYAKGDNVAITPEGNISLADPNPSITQTSDEDFNGGTSDIALNISSGSVTMKRQVGRPCDSNDDCVENLCTASVCAHICGVYVFSNNVNSVKWKGSQTSCIGPQCISGALVADNLVDFTDYPARNACKNLGGRLPTRAELACIYTNRAFFGSFENSLYWTNKESAINAAYVFDFGSGSETVYSKNYNYYARCVRDE